MSLHGFRPLSLEQRPYYSPISSHDLADPCRPFRAPVVLHLHPLLPIPQPHETGQSPALSTPSCLLAQEVPRGWKALQPLPIQLVLSSQGSAQTQLPLWSPSALPAPHTGCAWHSSHWTGESAAPPRGAPRCLPFLAPTGHLSSPLVEVVLRVVQPQANGYRVALPALSENVVHSSVPALSSLGWGSLGTVERSRERGEPQTLSPGVQ